MTILRLLLLTFHNPSQRIAMAQLNSFDVTTGVDMQEVDNAVNQSQKEIGQRYDFKGSKSTIEFQRAEEMLALTKLNWNHSQLDGRLPITLRASRKVGEILRHVPQDGTVARRYHYYM